MSQQHGISHGMWASPGGRGANSAVWALLVFSGVIVIGLAAQSRAARQLWRRMFGTPPPSSPRLQSFRAAIVGVDKETIEAALGPPRASAGRSAPIAAATWYYPIDPFRRIALVIEFDDLDVARATQVVRTPRFRRAMAHRDR